MAQHTQTMIPIQILADIDNARNPMQLTRDRLERAATENQFMNGKIAAIDASVVTERPITTQLILACSLF
jgi:mediator of RNA polymerase II transcription subunit 10